MQVGDLVKYKEHPSNGYGIVLKDDNGFYLLYWHDADPEHSDYIWEGKAHLEVISESR